MAIPRIRAGFRVAAFVECLVKLALHRLGSKGADHWGWGYLGIPMDPPFYEACWDELPAMRPWFMKPVGFMLWG